jgi:hypothetical protein
MKTGPGPAIDPSDMNTNQQNMFGVHAFNVVQQEHDAENSVKVSVPNAVDVTVNQSFVDAAPHLSFCLPFMSCNKPADK